MRRFGTRAESELRADAAETTRRVLRLLGTFRAQVPEPLTGAAVDGFCREVQGLLEQLANDERRLEDLADELVLREHWRARRSPADLDPGEAKPPRPR